jgi:hypothetical protein
VLDRFSRLFTSCPFSQSDLLQSANDVWVLKPLIFRHCCHEFRMRRLILQMTGVYAFELVRYKLLSAGSENRMQGIMEILFSVCCLWITIGDNAVSTEDCYKLFREVTPCFCIELLRIWISRAPTTTREYSNISRGMALCSAKRPETIECGLLFIPQLKELESTSLVVEFCIHES